MKKTASVLALMIVMLLPGHALAGDFLNSLNLKARAGYSIGGTAPLGIPATIRSLDAFRLTPSFMVGMDAMLPLGGNWGMAVGLRFENKAMDCFQVGRKVQLKAGPYVSLLLSKDFSGYVFDGYLRQNNPTGAKIVMGHEENERATYDFSDNMRNFQAGVAVGADWLVGKRIGVSADLSWGITGVHKSDFKTIEQTLYPIYGTIGVFYKIN